MKQDIVQRWVFVLAYAAEKQACRLGKRLRGAVNDGAFVVQNGEPAICRQERRAQQQWYDEAEPVH